MRYLLITLGSLGDLHPFLAVARSLATAGHQVELMANAPYQAAVEREGVRFTPLCTARDHWRTANHPDLWDPMRGFGVLWRHLAVPAVEPVYERVMTLVGDRSPSSEPISVLASPLAIGARLATARAGCRLCSVYTSPANLRPLEDPMFVGPYRVPVLAPTWVRRALWHALDRWKLEPMARKFVDDLCLSKGVAPVQGSLFGEWIHSPNGGMALFPESFGPAARIAGRGHVFQAEFPRFRASGDSLSEVLTEFLEAGGPPVVTFGGSNGGARGRELIRLVLQAATAMGQRCIVLGGPDADESGASVKTGEAVLRVRHAPLGELLPRASLFVHHGGIGSCAEGLAAGIPQVIMPFAYDQFDNAERVARLNAGTVVHTGRDGPARLLRVLQQISPLPRTDRTPTDRPQDELRAIAAIESWATSD